MSTNREARRENFSVEKETTMHLEYQPGHMLSSDDENFLAEYSVEAKNRVLRKVSPEKNWSCHAN